MLSVVHAAIESCDISRDIVLQKGEIVMLDINFEDNALMFEIEPEQRTVLCDACDKEALIFQDEGNYCLDCWQERTEPYITVNKPAFMHNADSGARSLLPK